MLPAEGAEPYDVAGDPRLAEALVTPLEEAKIRAIARQVRGDILAGRHAAGARLPTRVEMAKTHGVSAETIGNVMRMLAGEGLVSLEQGRGTFVQPVRSYEATATVPRADGGTIGDGDRDKAARRVRVQDDDDPAIEDSGVSAEADGLRIRLNVAAADSGRAASRAMAVARYACQEEDGWDMALASVTARPS